MKLSKEMKSLGGIFCLVLIVLTINGSAQITTNRSDAGKSNEERLTAAFQALPVESSRVFIYSLDPVLTEKERNLLAARIQVDAETVNGSPSREEKEIAKLYPNRFHGYVLLGSAEVASVKDKTSLIRNLARSIEITQAGWPAVKAACFEPRHGLRIITDSGTNDLLICFSCHRLSTEGFLIGESRMNINDEAKVDFERVRREYRLPKPAEHD